MTASPASTGTTTLARSHGARSKGTEIRERIEKNRAKRLQIAAAMKAEAGVTEHTVNERDLGGIWYRNTTRIHSPEGRRINQLVTLAHECGHNFLHANGIGSYLPNHVIEYEAERYADLALRQHGMTMPQSRKDFGRRYIASYFERDRALGWPIDQRVLDYVNGSDHARHDEMRRLPVGWRHGVAGVAPERLYNSRVLAVAQSLQEYVEAQKAINRTLKTTRTITATAGSDVTTIDRDAWMMRRIVIPGLAYLFLSRWLFGSWSAVPVLWYAALVTMLAGRGALDTIDIYRQRDLAAFNRNMAFEIGMASGWFWAAVEDVLRTFDLANLAAVLRSVQQAANNALGIAAILSLSFWWTQVSIPGPATSGQTALFVTLPFMVLAGTYSVAVIDRARDLRRWKRGLPPFDPLGRNDVSSFAPWPSRRL